ncbi:response regulator transcription factor [Nocardioides caricicola]|uniref:Response regulator transcription factor n=1 Tax=Nocardioides caricicola TaxID=634770 RepID=A0ABW0MX16_9ACTN
MAARAVVVEDEADTRELIDIVLRKAGIEVHGAETGDEGLRLIRDLKPDLVTLDVQLPDMQGTEVCRRLREFSDTFVMMITSRTDEVDRLLALDLGADDYLAKPFSTRELGARSAALLRRARAAEPERPEDDVVEAGGGLVLVPVRHVAMFEGNPVPLTPPEVDVLAVLAREPGRAWDRSDLVSEVWGGEFIESDYLIDVHVANLRRKLRKAGAGTDRIRTVEGAAYALASA